MSEKKPGKGRRMGSSRRNPRGNRIKVGGETQEGIDELVEEDNLICTGVKGGGEGDEAPPHTSAEHNSEVLSPSVEIDTSHSSSVCLRLSDSLIQTSVEPELGTIGKDLVHYEEPLLMEESSTLSVNLNYTTESIPELEDQAPNNKEGEIRDVEEKYPEEISQGEVLFSLAEENEHDKFTDNKEREDRNSEKSHTGDSPGQSPSIKEQSKNSVTADPVETVMGQKREEGEESSLLEEDLGSEISAQSGEIPAEEQDEKRIHQNTDQEEENDERQMVDRKTLGFFSYPPEVSDENIPFRCSGEINVQESEGHQEESVERGVHPCAKDRSADIMEYDDATPPQETSLPVPARREKRRKLGSTRKSSHMTEVQIKRGEEEDIVMGQKEAGEESSLLEHEILQAEQQEGKIIHYTLNQEKEMEFQGGVGESAGIPTHTLEPSEVSEQATQSTFSVAKERFIKNEGEDERERGQVRTYHTPAILDYSDQEEHSKFVREELHPDAQLGKTDTLDHSAVEITKQDNIFEENATADQLNQSVDSLLMEESSTLSVNFNYTTESIPELEDQAPNNKEGEIRDVEEKSPEEISQGEVLFSLAEENEHDKITDNKVREEDRNSEISHTGDSPGQSPTITEQSKNSVTAEQVETQKLQGTQLPLVVENIPFKCEGEINTQEVVEHHGKIVVQGIQKNAKDISADTMAYEDISPPQETSLPMPNREERRRKLGSTRRSMQRAKVQTETGEEEVMGQEREERQESSLLDEDLGSDIVALSEEMQEVKQKEMNIHQSSVQLFQHSSGLSVEKERASKEEREEREMEQVGMYHIPDISNYSSQVEQSFEKELISISNTQTNQDGRESTGFSVTESTKYEKSIENIVCRDHTLDDHTKQLCQLTNIVNHSADECGSSAVPHRRRKMGSSRKDLIRSPNQGAGEQLREQGEKADGGEDYVNDAYKEETEIDSNVALERKIEGAGKVGGNAPTIDERSDNNKNPSLIPQVQTIWYCEGNPHVESNSEAKITQMDSSHQDYKDPCKQNIKRSSVDVVLEDIKYIETGEMENKNEGSAVEDMKGDKMVAMVDRVSHGKVAREETEAESSAVAGKQDNVGPKATQSPAVRKKFGSRRKGRSSVWKEDRDLEEADEMRVEEDSRALVVLQRIQEVFHRWDSEEKGFITWDHMQGLSGELGLSVEELQQVFDRLDKNGDGLVTLDDVTTCFREFMRIQQPMVSPVVAVYQSAGSILREEEDDGESKLFLSMLDDLKDYSLLQDQSDIWRLWVELQHNEPHLLNNLEDFVSKVTEQIKTVQHEKDSLEQALKRHIQQHSVGVKELYEEMERQISTEKEKVKEESLQRSRSQLARLEEELDQRDTKIQTLNAVQNRLEGCLQAQKRQQQRRGLEKQELFRANKELEEELERIKSQLQETQSHLHALRHAHVHKPTHPQLLSLTEKAGQTEDSKPEVLNVDFNVQPEKKEVFHEAVVAERSGSGRDHRSLQDRCTGTQVKAHGRVISIEEDPMPDLLTGGLVSTLHNQGGALWEKQGGRARGQRESQSSVSHCPSVPDLLYNVVLVGNSSVGKTSFMRRFQSGVFNPDICATLGMDSCIQTVQVEGRRVILQMWDTAGQERYHSMTKQILRKAQGLVLMYDITSSDSFLALRYWLSSIEEGAPDDVIIMLLGNKNDSSKRKVSLEEGERLAREYNVHFMECSAVTGDNVVKSMNSLARMLKQQLDQKQGDSIPLNKGSPKKKSTCCG